MIYLSEINEEFFTLGNIVFDENSEAAFADNEILWTDVKSILFTKSKEEVILTLNNGEHFHIPVDTAGLVTMFKQMPAALNTPEQAAYIEEIFASLKSCKVCGNVAVWNGECHACHSSEEDVLNSDPKIELENIKEEQLNLFATYEEGEPVDWEFHIDPNYQRDPSWKLLVNEAEVLAFSEENTWDEDEE